MASIFTKIINKEISGHIVAEDQKHIAFLDISPLVRGHVLVVPKKETNYIFDLTDSELSELHIFSKRVAIGLKKAISCKRISTAVIGLEVPHVHIHLIPINNMDDCNFSRPKLHPDEESLRSTAALIRENIDKY